VLSDPKAYRFRPVSLADLPRLRAWLQTPEVVRWWGDPAEQLEKVVTDPLGVVLKLLLGRKFRGIRPHRHSRCCPCLGLDEGVVERTAPHGSAGGFLSGIFSIADLYAFSMAFCFSFSSGVIWRSGDKLIPGNGIWAEAAPVRKAIIAPAWTIFRSMSLVKRTMTQSMPNSASFASRISLLLSVMLFLIPIILCKNSDAADMSKASSADRYDRSS